MQTTAMTEWHRLDSPGQEQVNRGRETLKSGQKRGEAQL